MSEIFYITMEPSGRVLQAHEGDNLYTLLVIAGELSTEDHDHVQLLKGGIAPCSQPELEAAVYSSAELRDGWMLASLRRINANATIGISPTAAMGENTGELPLSPLADCSGYGLAIDIGGGTIGAGIIDLTNLHIPAVTGGANPQIRWGNSTADRINYCHRDLTGREKLQKATVAELNRLIEKLCSKSGISAEQISVVAIAADTAEGNLIWGQMPDEPVGTLRAHITRQKTAAQCGFSDLPADTACYLLPRRTASVGGDTIAAALAAGMAQKQAQDKLTLLIDIGCDTGIMLAGRGRLLATAVSSPSMVGLDLECGRPFGIGNITTVDMKDDLTLETVKDGRPVAISATGLLHLLCDMRRRGMLDSDGKLQIPEDLSEPLQRRFRQSIRGREFVLSNNRDGDVYISQNDIRQFQLAKGSIYAACMALMAHLNAGLDDVEAILIADSYNAQLEPQHLLELGIIPQVPRDKIRYIGNAAWQGAYLTLTDAQHWQECERLAKDTAALNLSNNFTFASEFIKAMEFPHKEPQQQSRLAQLRRIFLENTR